LQRELPRDFSKLRQALKPLVGGDLARVVYVSYANPALVNGAPCPGGRGGFDIHPAFNADPQRLAEVVNFVQNEFCRRPGTSRSAAAACCAAIRPATA
jgi:hypothetical protein